MNSSFDKIICAGKNYAAHAAEMGDSGPKNGVKKPVFFLKPPSCLVQSPKEPVILPKDRGSVHHECEIVYRIRRKHDRNEFEAVTLGLDLTLRDLQSELKKNGHPWEASKAFARSAVIGPWIDLVSFSDVLSCRFELLVNGKVTQSALGSEMTNSPVELLREAERLFDVRDGDLLFTGTPKGVGPIRPDDRLTLLWSPRLSTEMTFV